MCIDMYVISPVQRQLVVNMGVNMYLLCTNEIGRHAQLYLQYVHIMTNRNSPFRQPRIPSPGVNGCCIGNVFYGTSGEKYTVNRNHIQHAADDARLSFYSYVWMDGRMNVFEGDAGKIFGAAGETKMTCGSASTA